jgi:hypothetical protein
MAIRRDKSISSKVTAEEYEACKNAAGGRSVSEWNRTVLLRELDRQPRPIERRLLEEFWTLRYILTNALTMPGGETLAASMELLLKEADQLKAAQAMHMLKATV